MCLFVSAALTPKRFDRGPMLLIIPPPRPPPPPLFHSGRLRWPVVVFFTKKGMLQHTLYSVVYMRIYIYALLHRGGVCLSIPRKSYRKRVHMKDRQVSGFLFENPPIQHV